jgi:hypothetical protein
MTGARQWFGGRDERLGAGAHWMISIFEIDDWQDLASFAVWTLAVCAMAKAIFGSFLAAELQYWLARRDQLKRQRMHRLNWELANRSRWDPDVARGSPHAAAVGLSEKELDARRVELRRLSRASLPWRAMQYLLGCWACQTFWTAFLVYALTAGHFALGAALLTPAAYSGAAVVLSGLFQRKPASLERENAAPPKRCGHCGG